MKLATVTLLTLCAAASSIADEQKTRAQSAAGGQDGQE